MKKLFAATALVLATASLVPAMVAPAEAVIVTKRVMTTRRGLVGAVRTTRRVCG